MATIGNYRTNFNSKSEFVKVNFSIEDYQEKEYDKLILANQKTTGEIIESIGFIIDQEQQCYSIRIPFNAPNDLTIDNFDMFADQYDQNNMENNAWRDGIESYIERKVSQINQKLKEKQINLIFKKEGKDSFSKKSTELNNTINAIIYEYINKTNKDSFEINYVRYNIELLKDDFGTIWVTNESKSVNCRLEELSINILSQIVDIIIRK